jgi:hypothetical protein
LEAGKAERFDNSLLPIEAKLAPGLILLDAAVGAEDIQPGVPLRVRLLWRSDDELPDIRPRLTLVQDEVVLAENSDAPANGRYPTSNWIPGERVLEERQLLIPPGSTGEAALWLELGDERFILTTIAIQEQDHLLTMPQTDVVLNEQFGDIALLAGFDLEQRSYSTAEPIPLTLIWQSLVDGSDEDYVVFTHLLAEDGRVIAQHDGPPVSGARPISSWVSGEYIVDRHGLQFRDTAYEGPAMIEVGLYEPTSGRRVTLLDGTDHLLLPVWLEIIAGE